MAGNIRVYNEQRLGISPNERASDALAGQARTVGALYDRAASSYNRIGDSLAGGIRAVGQVTDDYVAHREISSGGLNYAKMQQSLSSAWDNVVANADPNDGTVGQRFLQEVVEPTVQEFSKGFWSERGQKWAQSRAMAFRDHMFTKTAADMSTMAGVALETNLVQSINSYTNTVRTDPSSLQSVMEAYRSQVENVVATSVNLKGVAGVKARMSATQKGLEAIVQAAISSAIDKNPQAGLEMAKDPELMKYVGGKDIKAFEREAKAVERERREDYRWSVYLKDKKAKEVSDQGRMDATFKILEGDPSITLKSLREREDLLPDDKRLLGQMLVREQKPATFAKESRAASVEAFQRMALPDGDPNKITELKQIDAYYAQGRLTKEDYKFLREELAQPRTTGGQRVNDTMTRFLADQRRAIMKPDRFGAVSPADVQAAYAFEMDTRERVREYVKAGKDPMELFMPDSPAFLGGPKNLRLYVQPSTERVREGFRPATSKQDPAPVPGAKKDRDGNWRRPVFDPVTRTTKWRLIGSPTPAAAPTLTAPPTPTGR
jgi:hypothetical protein